MKILLIIEASSGGTGRHVLDLARQLHDNGQEVHLVYSPTRADKSFQNEIANTEFATFPITMRRAPHPADLFSFLKLRKYIRTNGPFDVIHGHSSKAGALARFMKVGLIGPTRIVYTPHAVRTLDPTLSDLARMAWLQIERFLGRWMTDAIVAVSPDELEHVVEERIIAPEKAHLVINGLVTQPPDRRTEVRTRFGITDDQFCLGFVGRFAPQKAPELLIEAFAEVAERFPNLQLVMLGFGEQEPMVRRLIAESLLEDRIQVRTNESGFECMSGFDAFVMPSRYEGMPYVLLEAAAAALPIVATEVGGVAAVVRDEQNGLVIPVDDKLALVRAISRLISEPDLLERLQERALTSSNDHTAERMAMETAEVYLANAPTSVRPAVVSDSRKELRANQLEKAGAQ